MCRPGLKPTGAHSASRFHRQLMGYRGKEEPNSFRRCWWRRWYSRCCLPAHAKDGTGAKPLMDINTPSEPACRHLPPPCDCTRLTGRDTNEPSPSPRLHLTVIRMGNPSPFRSPACRYKPWVKLDHCGLWSICQQPKQTETPAPRTPAVGVTLGSADQAGTC